MYMDYARAKTSDTALCKQKLPGKALPCVRCVRHCRRTMRMAFEIAVLLTISSTVDESSTEQESEAVKKG